MEEMTIWFKFLGLFSYFFEVKKQCFLFFLNKVAYVICLSCFL